jgi:hypothetical protein
MGRMTERSRDDVLEYVKTLVEAGYPWEMVQVRYTIGGDNGPVDPQLPDFVKAWNETFEWPRLVINTAEAMFAEFERRYGATLPTRSGDMTPYWEDGAISTAGEESLVRASARRLVQAETLWSLRDPKTFPSAEAAEAWRNVLLWHEHTWGAADSISQPDRADVVAQWTYKRQFALEADRQSNALLQKALAAAPLSTTAAGPVIVDVVNTLSWPRKGLVVLDTALAEGRDRVSLATGRLLSSQRLSDGRLAVFMDNVPAFGAARIRIERGPAAAPKASQVRVIGTSIDNGLVRAAMDDTTGDIKSLQLSLSPGSPPGGRQKAEFVSGAQGLNSYLYVPGRNPGDARPAGRSRISVEESGPLVATLRVESEAPGTRSLVRRVTVVAGDPTVHIEDVLDKLAVRTKESAHIAFPFNLPGATVRADEGAAIVVPDINQVDGSCRDFIGVHSTVDIANAKLGVALATLDAPLVEMGAITDERQDPKTRVRSWPTKTAPGSTIYAYLLNNYWHTNYKADQEGPLTFRVVLRPHAGRASSLRRFGQDCEQPLLVRPVAAGTPVVRAAFSIESAAAVVSSVRYETTAAAFVLRLYNPSERETSARIVSNVAGSGLRVEVAAEDRAATRMVGGRIVLKPFATALVRVTVPVTR